MSVHDICVIGHLTRDLVAVPGEAAKTQPGGVAHYAGIALASLGLDTGVLTKLAAADAAELLAPLAAAGAAIHCRASPATSRFQNLYSGPDLGCRRQVVGAVAAPFEPGDLAGIEARAVLLGPLTSTDMSLEFLAAAAALGSRVALDVQGFTRRLDDGEVRAADWPEKRRGLALVALAKADLAEARILTGEPDPERAARALAALGPEEVLVTLGRAGSLVCAGGRVVRIPAFAPRALVDRTGCGDSYLAGYLFHRSSSDDVEAAGRFAAALATRALERAGAFAGGEAEVRALLEAARPA